MVYCTKSINTRKKTCKKTCNVINKKTRKCIVKIPKKLITKKKMNKKFPINKPFYKKNTKNVSHNKWLVALKNARKELKIKGFVKIKKPIKSKKKYSIEEKLYVLAMKKYKVLVGGNVPQNNERPFSDDMKKGFYLYEKSDKDDNDIETDSESDVDNDDIETDSESDVDNNDETNSEKSDSDDNQQGITENINKLQKNLLQMLNIPTGCISLDKLGIFNSKNTSGDADEGEDANADEDDDAGEDADNGKDTNDVDVDDPGDTNKNLY